MKHYLFIIQAIISSAVALIITAALLGACLTVYKAAIDTVAEIRTANEATATMTRDIKTITGGDYEKRIYRSGN